MQTSSRRQFWILFALALAGVCACFTWFVWRGRQQIDLGSQPPAAVFARIFKMPVPTGVSDLKVAGYSFTSGIFCAKFRARDVDAAILAMKRNSLAPMGELKKTSDFDDFAMLEFMAKSRYAKSIGWGEVLRIRQPEYYNFTDAAFPESGWFGSVIVHRQTSNFYIYGNLL